LNATASQDEWVLIPLAGYHQTGMHLGKVIKQMAMEPYQGEGGGHEKGAKTKETADGSGFHCR
jgi:hypothetical protein